jgi:hypothetical protein
MNRLPPAPFGAPWLLLLGLLPALAPLAHAPLAAQSVTVDQGSFRIFLEGRAAGLEAFAIRRSGAGADLQMVATAEIELQVPEGNTTVTPLLQTAGGDMGVSGYQIRVSGALQEEVVVTLGDRRFLSRVRSERGEREREYRATAGTVLLDPGVAHQYYFVAQRLSNRTVTIPVISPREGRQFDLTVTTVSDSTPVQLEEGTVTGRQLRLEGDGRVRNLWVDAEGRVLRVEDPERGYLAVRVQQPG